MTFAVNLQGDFAKLQQIPRLLINFCSDIDAQIDRYVVDCKSLLGLLSLSIDRDLKITIYEKKDGEAQEIYNIMTNMGIVK